MSNLIDDEILDGLNDTSEILDDLAKKELSNHLYEPIYLKDDICSLRGDAEDEVGLLFVVTEDSSNKYCYFPLVNGVSDENGELCVCTCITSETISEMTDISEDIWNKLVEHTISRKDQKALDVLLNQTYRKDELCNYDEFDSKFVGKHYKLNEVEKIIRQVNLMSLPEQLQEKRCTTFSDLYKSVNTLCILNEKPTKDYEDGTDALGCYSKKGTHKEILLYLDSIYEHYWTCLPKLSGAPFLSFYDLLKVVYIHELFHAYFDTFNKDVCNVVTLYVEEPLADYATLLTIQDDSHIYDLVKKDIADKFAVKSCRQYGLGSEDIGVDILKKYKYMKFILETVDINDYIVLISNMNSTKHDCLCQLKSVFTGDNK